LKVVVETKNQALLHIVHLAVSGAGKSDLAAATGIVIWKAFGQTAPAC
jgi:hypothetical protein